MALHRPRALAFATEKLLPSLTAWLTKNDARLHEPAAVAWEAVAAGDKTTAAALLASDEHAGFDVSAYHRALATKTFGRVFCYQPVVGSTQTMLMSAANAASVPGGGGASDGDDDDAAPLSLEGLAILADIQEDGKGRGRNVWESPQGSLAVSFVANYTSGATLPFVQYLVSLAVVKAVKGQPGAEDLPLHIKWPNDIYVNRTHKVGGILCNSQYDGRTFSVVIGFGLNINNSKPTTCINDVIREHQAGKEKGLHDTTGATKELPTPESSTSASAPPPPPPPALASAGHTGGATATVAAVVEGEGDEPRGDVSSTSTSTSRGLVLTREEVLARFFNSFEQLQDEFLERGFAPFESEYTEHWLHSNQPVQVERRRAERSDGGDGAGSGSAGSGAAGGGSGGGAGGEAQPAGDTQQLQAARIVGIAKSGNLTVQFVDDAGQPDGPVVEVIPDTSSLDMLRGLVTHKAM
jgi:biotin-(acetyl-CoA carboxylase) ligase